MLKQDILLMKAIHLLVKLLLFQVKIAEIVESVHYSKSEIVYFINKDCSVIMLKSAVLLVKFVV